MCDTFALSISTWKIKRDNSVVFWSMKVLCYTIFCTCLLSQTYVIRKQDLRYKYEVCWMCDILALSICTWKIKPNNSVVFWSIEVLFFCRILLMPSFSNMRNQKTEFTLQAWGSSNVWYFRPIHLYLKNQAYKLCCFLKN